MGYSPVDEVVRKYAKYPGHLAEKDRLKAIKAYIRHELASLCNYIVVEIPLFKKLEGCQNPGQSVTSSDCSKVYEEVCDLFYALSLIYKRKFIAKELTAKNCKWSETKIKLGDLILSLDNKKLKYKPLRDIHNDIGLRDEACREWREYEIKRGDLVNDPIIVVKEEKEGNTYYRILDGNGRALYWYCKSNYSLDTEIGAYVGECNGAPRDICVPFGIVHFLTSMPAYFLKSLLDRFKP